MSATDQIQDPPASGPDEPKRNPLPMVIAAIVAVALIAGVALLLAGNDDGDAEATEEGQAEGGQLEGAPVVEDGGPAPDVAFEYFDGTEGTLADFEGQPVVVNFFASWCGPCKTEMPEFEEVHQELGDEVAFVGMNVQDRLEDGIRTAEETGVTYTLARDLNDQLYTSVGVFGMPTTVFIDADGIIIRQWTGILSGDELRQIIQTDLLS